MKTFILIATLACVLPSAALAGYTAPTPRPSYSAPKMSAPKVSVTPKTYTPPTRPYAPPIRIPSGAPSAAFHDIHSSSYWANPHSPYFYLWLAQYGQQDKGDSTPWWVWALVGGGCLAVVGGSLLWIGRM